MTRPRRRHRRRPVRLLRRRPAAQGGRRGRPVRRAADAVRARARRRRARPPEDQVGHADVRQDRAASGVPLLRRRRARRRRDAARSCWSATTRSSTRSARRPTTGWASPATTARGRSPPPSSSPGTTATRAHADEAFDLSCERAVVVGNGNVAIDVARMLVLDPDELASTDTADHAIAAFAAASVTEVVILGRRGPAQAAFTNPELRELGELARADVVVDAGRARARSGQRRVARVRRRLPHRAPERRHAARVRGPAAGRELAPHRAALLPLAGRGPRRRRTGR